MDDPRAVQIDRPLRVVAVDGNPAPASTTALLAGALAERIGSVAGVGRVAEAEVVPLHRLRLDLARWVGPGSASPELAAAVDAVTTADVLVLTTPVHHGTFSGLFKLFVDALDRYALTGTTVVVAANGGSPRHTLVLDQALRPLVSSLGGHSVPTGVFVSRDEVRGRTAAGGGVLHPRVLRRMTAAAQEAVRLARSIAAPDTVLLSG